MVETDLEKQIKSNVCLSELADKIAKILNKQYICRAELKNNEIDVLEEFIIKMSYVKLGEKKEEETICDLMGMSIDEFVANIEKLFAGLSNLRQEGLTKTDLWDWASVFAKMSYFFKSK